MTIPQTLPKVDPRSLSAARETIAAILGSLTPPPNYKITLEVDKSSEKLIMKVLKRDNWETRIMGVKLWRVTQDWTDPECEQRRIEGRTYESLLQQLHDSPEFLEFELSMEGALHHRPTQIA